MAPPPAHVVRGIRMLVAASLAQCAVGGRLLELAGEGVVSSRVGDHHSDRAYLEVFQDSFVSTWWVHAGQDPWGVRRGGGVWLSAPGSPCRRSTRGSHGADPKSGAGVVWNLRRNRAFNARILTRIEAFGAEFCDEAVGHVLARIRPHSCCLRQKGGRCHADGRDPHGSGAPIACGEGPGEPGPQTACAWPRCRCYGRCSWWQRRGSCSACRGCAERCRRT